MTQENREKMQRAIGMIEGLSWNAEGLTSEGLSDVCEILDEVLKSESENK